MRRDRGGETINRSKTQFDQSVAVLTHDGRLTAANLNGVVVYSPKVEGVVVTMADGTTMMIDAKELAAFELDPKREAEVLSWLRLQDDTSRFEFIWRTLRTNAQVGLALLKRAELKPVFLEAILEHGFVYADASAIRFWLEAVVGGLGHRRLIRLVSSHLADAPLVVYKCVYWLPLVCESHPELHDDIRSLVGAFEAQHPNFQSSRSTGIHSTNP
jgi:hypothetical protein